MQEANLFSIPLTVQVDESATNLSEWTVSNFVYCNQVTLYLHPCRCTASHELCQRTNTDNAHAATLKLEHLNHLQPHAWHAGLTHTDADRHIHVVPCMLSPPSLLIHDIIHDNTTAALRACRSG